MTNQDTNNSTDPIEEPSSTFEQQVDQRPPGFVAEFVDFLLHNKAWWLTPIIVVLLLVGVLILLGSTGLAPYIYSVG